MFNELPNKKNRQLFWFSFGFKAAQYRAVFSRSICDPSDLLCFIKRALKYMKCSCVFFFTFWFAVGWKIPSCLWSCNQEFINMLNFRHLILLIPYGAQHLNRSEILLIQVTLILTGTETTRCNMENDKQF